MADAARWVLCLVVLFMSSSAAAQTGSGDDGATGCGPFDWPCLVVIPLGASAGLLFLVGVRIIVLARRIRRGPSPGPGRMGTPPDLRDPAPAATAPEGPPRRFPVEHPPWPDERAHSSGLPASPSRGVLEPPKQQVTWGDHRLWFADGAYVFSIDMDVPDDWLPCFSVPKGQRIVVGRDGAPRLERFDPRHPSVRH